MKNYCLGLSLTTILIGTLQSGASFAAPGTPEDYIETVSQELFATTALVSPAERIAALTIVIDQYFDLDVVARGVVGQHSESLTDEQMIL